MKADVGSDVVDDAAATVPRATVPVVLFRTATVLAESDIVAFAGGEMDQPATLVKAKVLVAVNVAPPVPGQLAIPPQLRVQAPLGHEIVELALNPPG